MTLRITTLCENTADRHSLLGEWGLSILVETDEGNILLDTGGGLSAIHNARALRVKLGKIDKIVLSHGHRDHTGGLRSILKRVERRVEIIAHPDAFQPKYSSGKSHRRRFAGIPFQIEELESLGARLNITREPVKISEHIMTTGEVPMVTEFEQVDARLHVKKPSGWTPDAVMDDQSLIIKTENGLVVILGCAHRGIINHLRHIQNITGTPEIYAVIGGCHLFNASKDRIQKTIQALKSMNVRKLGVSHCTGMEASVMMAKALGDRFFFNNAGTVIKIPEEK